MQATNPLLRPLTALVGERTTGAVRRRSARARLGIVRGSTKDFRRDRDSGGGRWAMSFDFFTGQRDTTTGRSSCPWR